MPLTQISRLRPGLSRYRAALRILPGPRAAAWPLVMAWLIICGMLAFLPGWWVADWRNATLDAWFRDTQHKASRLTQEWEHWTVPVPAFSKGDEPEVRNWLAREPLVTALVDPSQGHVWINDGTKLRLTKDPKEVEEPGSWVRTAIEISGGWTRIGQRSLVPRAERTDGLFDAGVWWLVGARDPKCLERCAIVTFFGKWCLVKSFVPGSPDAERWLQGTLGPGSAYRFGLVQGKHCDSGLLKPRSIWDYRREFGPGEQGRLLFKDPLAGPFRVDNDLSHSFGGMWYAVLQMSPQSFQAFWKAYLLRLRVAWTTYALIVASSGLAVALVLFARNREKVLADRLATLTHSLKTPLAILKLRCDTALNPDLPRETQEASLLEIRSEVDHLVGRIEAGLEEMRSRYASAARDRIDGAFFENLDEDLTPAFEAQGRLFEVYGADVTVRCCSNILRASLLTLIENALKHGRGRVTVMAKRLERKVVVTVSDEGPGIPAARLEALKRRRSAGVGPGQREGEGMGLLVLADLVKQEGWGLEFGRDEAGFTARLELPA